MKKNFCFILFIILFTAGKIIAEQPDSAKQLYLYYDNDEIAEEYREQLGKSIEEFRLMLKDTGIEVKFQNSYVSKEGFSEYTVIDPKSKNYEATKQKIIQKYLDKGYSEEDIEEAPSKSDFYSDRGKNVIGIRQKFPFMFLECGYSNSENGSFNVSYYEESMEYSKSLTSSFCSSPENISNVYSEYIKALVTEIAGQTYSNKKEAPVFIDSFTLNTKSSASSFSEVAARNDYSFVMKDGNDVYEVSAACEIKQNLTDLLNMDDSAKKGKAWVLISPDGNSVLFMNGSDASKDGSVYCFDSNGNYEKTLRYTLSSESTYVADFTKEGVPYSSNNSGMDQLNYFFGTLDFSEPKPWKYSYGRMNYGIAGPDETMFIQRYNSIFVYNRDGSVRNIIHNWSDNDERNNWNILFVNEDFSIILGKAMPDTSKLIMCISQESKILWQMNLPKGTTYTTLSDSRNGMYYFVNYSTVLRYAEQSAPIPAFLKKVSEYNNAINSAETIDAKLYLSIADEYLTDDGLSEAKTNIEKYLLYNPADSAAKEKLLKVTAEYDKRTAASYAEKALELYDLYGVESGRENYQNAMKVLEKLKRQLPGDAEVAELYSELKKAFAPDSQVSSKVPDLEVVSVDFSVLFPALMNVYSSQPAGYLKVKNNGKETLKNISVSSFIRKYMDFATEGEVLKELKPGETGLVEVKTLLNKNVLSVNEDTNIQTQFTVNWECGGKKENCVLVRPVTVYKKTAMSWTDTAMLSCFIMPNDSTVSAFAFKALESSEGASGEHTSNEKQIVSKNFFRAMKLVNALGCIPLNYVPDPVTPVSSVMENEYAVDTVRFPADTLAIKGGDCDDMTTVLCSVLESAGVPAALITTPGHIFSAFNTGLKYNSVWKKLDSEYLALEYEGEAWIPVESTVLYEGFESSWKTASKEVKAAFDNDDEFEFIPLAEKRSLYPPVSSDEKNIVAVEFKSDREEKNAIVKNALIADVFEPVLKQLVSGCKECAVLNSAAKFYYSLGNTQKAIDVLNTAFALDASNVPVLNNLVALYKSTGDNKRAQEIMTRAKKLKEFKKAPVMVKDFTPAKNSSESNARASEKDTDAVESLWLE